VKVNCRIVVLSLSLVWPCVEGRTADQASADAQLQNRLSKHCVDCHSTDPQEGDVRLDNFAELSDARKEALLNRIEEQVVLGRMPPQDGDQPTAAERNELLTVLTSSFAALGTTSMFREKMKAPGYANYVDHDTMHPGIWLGFGDISAQDFWRNKAAMEHLRFVIAPTIVDGRLRFATECHLKTSTGEPLCLLTNDFTVTARPNGWLLVWSAEFRADQRPIVFGDQEEMGIGARVATPFTEKNGGIIRSSTGKKTAKETWGQPAKWCDYSGSGPQSGGIMLMASDKNFRESWWHNRDYGVFVANPFGREAMKQGPRSAVTVAQGETLKITFGALIHDHREFDMATEYAAFILEKR
jgi:hypothetical protein